MEVHGGSAFYFMQETAAKRIWVAHHGCNMWNRLLFLKMEPPSTWCPLHPDRLQQFLALGCVFEAASEGWRLGHRSRHLSAFPCRYLVDLVGLVAGVTCSCQVPDPRCIERTTLASWHILAAALRDVTAIE